jgi:hypothetical protein
MNAFQIFHIQLRKRSDKLIEWPMIRVPSPPHLKFHMTSSYVMHMSVNMCALHYIIDSAGLHVIPKSRRIQRKHMYVSQGIHSF